MRLEFETYWPLILLLMVPALWLVQRRTETDMSAKHLRLAGVIRSVIVILLVLAIMQPVLYRTGAFISAVYLLDVSQSVSPPAIQSAIQWIADANQAGRPAHAQFVPFSNNSRVFDSLDQLKTVGVSSRGAEGSIDQSATDLESAVDRAVRAFQPHYLKRLVLMTDGNENTGRVLNVAPKLKQEGVRVFSVPLPARSQRDVWTDDIMAPLHVTAEELFPLDVHVYSQLDTSAEVEVKQGDKTLGKRNVKLKQGMNRVAFETQLKDTGPVTLEAEVKASEDSFPDNNKFRESVVVQGKPRVLYIEGHTESVRYLRKALETDGLVVDAVSSRQIPQTVEELDRYDAVDRKSTRLNSSHRL